MYSFKNLMIILALPSPTPTLSAFLGSFNLYNEMLSIYFIITSSTLQYLRIQEVVGRKTIVSQEYLRVLNSNEIILPFLLLFLFVHRPLLHLLCLPVYMFFPGILP